MARPAAANIYMGAPVEVTTLPKGSVVNAAAIAKLRRTAYTERTVEVVAPGVWVLGGHSFVNVTVIETADGLIVYDTGEHMKDGEKFAPLIASLSDKPIIAILYSHSHYVHGTRALIGDGDGVLIVGHSELNANVAQGGFGSAYPETAPLQMARMAQQFNQYTPRTGPDSPASTVLNFGRTGFAPVNTPVAHGERLTIGGLELQFFTAHGSDTDDCLTVWIPSRSVCLNNLFWPMLPNVYTLRGAKFRDPRVWIDGLRLIRDLAPEHLVNTHARTISGRNAARAALDAYADGLAFILDQTLRGALLGLGPDELRSFVKLPAHLEATPNLAEIYGEVAHYPPYLYNHALGWFDGDAATINPLHPDEEAARLVDAMGGLGRVAELARAAFERSEYAWAAQLATYAMRLDRNDPALRQMKADILRRMGQITPAGTVRSWYITQALELEGAVTVPRLMFPGVATLAQAEPAEPINAFRVRVDPEKAAELDLFVVIAITDRSARHGLAMRRGVVEFIADPDAYGRPADLELASSYDAWLRHFSCRLSRQDWLAGVALQKGDPALLSRFFECFDDFSSLA